MNRSIEKATLKITLKSDLICGSGAGFSNVIDTDIVFDEYGFPYIPARRLRGLIKEAANEYAQFDRSKKEWEERLFGAEESHHFVLRNALLDGAERMQEEIRLLDNETKKYVNANAILNYYTTLRNQTRINDQGIAEDNSLRTSRAIQRGNVFYAPVEFEKEDQEDLKKLLVFVKHMGVNRTRGFGEVVVELQQAEQTTEESKFEAIQKLENETRYEILLCVENKSQLSITGSEGEKIVDYIPGSNVLGYFAGQYVRSSEYNQREFNRLFLEGNIQFKNGYISDEEWNRYDPVKESVFKEKTENKYYDRSIDSSLGRDKIINKVRGKYASQTQDGIRIREVFKEMAYHHRRPEDKSIGHVISNEEDLGMFYQTEVISSGQRFILPIEGKGKDLKQVLRHETNTLQIGASKHTQYGNIEVQKVIENKMDPIMIPSGTEVVATLLSPALILNEQLFNDLSVTALCKACHLEKVEDEYKFVDFVRIGGYNAKWKLQKPSYTAFKGGTVLRGTLTQDTSSHFVIGEYRNEGLGQVWIQKVSDVQNRIQSGTDDYSGTKCEITNQKIKRIYTFNKKQEVLQQFTKLAIEKKDQGMTASEIGRVLSMLNDSGTWKEFEKQVEQIANKDRNKKVASRIERIKKDTEQVMDVCGFKTNDPDPIYKETCRIYFTNRKLEKRDE